MTLNSFDIKELSSRHRSLQLLQFYDIQINIYILGLKLLSLISTYLHHYKEETKLGYQYL
jgi:hypothetical protein